MIITVSNKAYTGSPTPYFMALQDRLKRQRPIPPRLLRGDISSFDRMLATMHAKRAYASLQLSWDEPLEKVTVRRLLQILEERRAVTYPGVKPHHIATLSVLHAKLENFHVHEADLQLHLLSGHKLTTYFSSADFRRFKLWQESVNLRFGFTSPTECRAEISAPDSPITPRQHIAHVLRKVVEEKKRQSPGITDEELFSLLQSTEIVLPGSRKRQAQRGRLTILGRKADCVFGAVAGIPLKLRGTLFERLNRNLLPGWKNPLAPQSLEQNLRELTELVRMRFVYLKTRLPPDMMLAEPACPWLDSPALAVARPEPKLRRDSGPARPKDSLQPPKQPTPAAVQVTVPARKPNSFEL